MVLEQTKNWFNQNDQKIKLVQLVQLKQFCHSKSSLCLDQISTVTNITQSIFWINLSHSKQSTKIRTNTSEKKSGLAEVKNNSYICLNHFVQFRGYDLEMNNFK